MASTYGSGSKVAPHQRNNSDELDVFAATSYFSGYGEATCRGSAGAKAPKAESNYPVVPRRVMRMSLDEAPRQPNLQRQGHDKVAHKQPSSPGGKLASFLYSFFNQTSKKTKSSKSGNGEEKSGKGGRRKRRSSISHFAASTTDSNSISSLNSACKPFTVRSHTSLKDATYHGNRYSHVVSLPSLPLNGKGRREYSHLQTEKAVTKFPEKVISYKWPGNKCGVADDDRGYLKFTTCDEGADSDSSSDLFELQNYDVGMKRTTLIKIAAPVASTVVS